MVIGYIILGFVICAAIFGPLGYLFWFLKNRKIWSWPSKGKHTIGKYEKFTAHLFTYKVESELEFSEQETADRAALAAFCLNEQLFLKNEDATPATEFTLHVLDDESYDKIYDASKIAIGGVRSNGMQLELNKRAGSDTMPLLAMRGSKFKTTPETGSLVIHELLHEVLPRTKFRDVNDDLQGRKHDDKRVWGSGDSVEGLSQKYFKENVEKLLSK